MLLRMWRLDHCYIASKKVQPLWIRVWQFLKKLKMQLPNNPAITILCIYLRKIKTYIHTRTCISIFIAAFSMIDRE